MGSSEVGFSARVRFVIPEGVVRRVFAALDLLVSVLLGISIFVGLPDRWWPVDVFGTLLIALFATSGVGLLRGADWGERVARATSMVSLVIGLALVALLVVSASYLQGIYGAVGRGGAVIFLLIVAMVFPYLVVFPAAQLLWLGPRGARSTALSRAEASG